MWVDVAEIECRVCNVRVCERNEHRAVDSWVALLFHC